MKEKELIVLERSNGFFGGYENRNGEYIQIFNMKKNVLPVLLKQYGDDGYTIKRLGKEKEEEFMKDRICCLF